jgi:hypothetical protein
MGTGEYAIAALFAAAVVVASVTAPRRTRGVLAALTILCLGGYAMIAVGRAWLYAVSPGLATSTRYHYAAPILIALMLAVVLARVRLPLAPASKDVLALAFAAGLVWQLEGSGWTINHFQRERDATAQVIAEVQAAAHDAAPGAVVHVPNQYPFPPSERMAGQYVAGSVTVFALFYPDDVIDGRRVRFVTRDPAALKTVRPATRIARLLEDGSQGGASGPPR